MKKKTNKTREYLVNCPDLELIEVIEAVSEEDAIKQFLDRGLSVDFHGLEVLVNTLKDTSIYKISAPPKPELTFKKVKNA